MKDVFVVEALRWGSRENHSYVVGAFDSLDDAAEACVVEEAWRGGKYVCVIINCSKSKDEIQKQKAEILDELDMKRFNLEVLTRMDQYLGRYDETSD